MSAKKSGEQDERQALILLVDDVPKNLQVLGSMLREKGYKIAAATGGAQALEMALARPPDLILLDVMMPEIDGFKVCEKLKTSIETKDIPIIFLTASTESESVVKGFECGAVDYVTKPFNKGELLARVTTHLKLQRAQKEIVRLEQKNAALAMAVTASHELNQPLTVLEGNLQLFQAAIARIPLSDKQQKYMEKINTSLEKIQVLLKKFSDADSIHFEDYVGKQKMVVFEESEKP
jgi:DNA-binding response OmpR family regulator